MRGMTKEETRSGAAAFKINNSRAAKQEPDARWLFRVSRIPQLSCYLICRRRACQKARYPFQGFAPPCPLRPLLRLLLRSFTCTRLHATPQRVSFGYSGWILFRKQYRVSRIFVFNCASPSVRTRFVRSTDDPEVTFSHGNDGHLHRWST